MTSSVKEEPIQLTDAAYLPFPAKCKLCLKPPSLNGFPVALPYDL